MSLPKRMSGYQALAWIAWRSEKAVRAFSGKNAEALWNAAEAGDFPKGLGKPSVTPTMAERELRQQMQSGVLPWDTVKKPKKKSGPLPPEEAARRMEAGEEVYLNVEDVMNLLGRAGAEALLQSLRNGDLVGYRMNGDGERMLLSKDVEEWMAAHPQYWAAH